MDLVHEQVDKNHTRLPFETEIPSFLLSRFETEHLYLARCSHKFVDLNTQ